MASREAFTSYNVLQFSLADGAGLDEAVKTAEASLARGMLIPDGGWQRAGERAAARLTLVTDTSAWRGVSWTCTVLCEESPLGKPTWYLQRQLAAQFDPIRHPLGNTGMDLDRAIRTAQRHLRLSGWTPLGAWTRSDHSAVVQARPPAKPTARPELDPATARAAVVARAGDAVQPALRHPTVPRGPAR
jgi:hypothetical protein